MGATSVIPTPGAKTVTFKIVALIAGAAMSTFTVELLRSAHNREVFDCGNRALNASFRTQARQDMERGVAVIYVLVPESARDRVAGFYSLSSTSVKLTEWPEGVRRKLPRYPRVPATLIGRLAVSLSYRGQRLGERLLVDALARSLAASRTVASNAVIVDAKEPETVTFYQRYGFISFPGQPQRLFLPMKTIAKLV
jgi:predicted GNAT family N-acyltransferase